jgi:two-component system nitrogen regulation response regulator GlnG
MYPVGADEPVATDVRLVAATDADLEEHIADGRFKAPLLHRLAGYEIRLPPLRERREDIGALFLAFAREELETIGEAHKLSPTDPYAEPWLPAPVAAMLTMHPWPGNIRQLRNVTRQLVIGSRGSPRLVVHPRLAWELSRPEGPASQRRPTERAPARDDDSGVKSRRRASEIPGAEIVAALRESAWDFKAAADRLGIPRSSIYDALDRCPGVRMAGDLAPEEIARCYRECRGDLDLMVQRLEVSARALKRRLRELGLAVKRA